MVLQLLGIARLELMVYFRLTSKRIVAISVNYMF